MEEEQVVLLRYYVEAWVDEGYSDTVRESLERALVAESHVSDFGVDPGEQV